MAPHDGDDPLPVDLLVVASLAVTAAGVALVVPTLPTTAGHVLAVVVVLLPGYALVAALFPRGPLGPDEPPGRPAERVRRLDGFERLVLSTAAGLLVTPLVGIAVDFSPFGFFETPVVASVTGFVLVTSAVATVRRRRVPATERYVPHRRWLRSLGRVRTGQPRSAPAVVTVAVAVAVVVAAGGVFAVVGTAETGERFTELSLLVESDDGLLVAGSYPSAVEVGEEVGVVVAVENREQRRQTYTLVPRLERVVERSDDTRVVGFEAFERVGVTVPEGRTERRELRVRPTTTGENLRLSVLLYRGTPPEEPTATNAYRRTHVWLNVTDAASE
jgi:uncharacterized membrane protein